MKAKTDKEIVKKYYLLGYNAKEISHKFGYDVEAVRKCIQRNYANLKNKHKIAEIERKETIKAVNYEANKFISDSSFIRKNRTIYETKPNGDIILNRNIAPVVTWDTPRRLTNENKTI